MAVLRLRCTRLSSSLRRCIDAGAEEAGACTMDGVVHSVFRRVVNVRTRFPGAVERGLLALCVGGVGANHPMGLEVAEEEDCGAAPDMREVAGSPRRPLQIRFVAAASAAAASSPFGARWPAVLEVCGWEGADIWQDDRRLALSLPGGGGRSGLAMGAEDGGAIVAERAEATRRRLWALLQQQQEERQGQSAAPEGGGALPEWSSSLAASALSSLLVPGDCNGDEAAQAAEAARGSAGGRLSVEEVVRLRLVQRARALPLALDCHPPPSLGEGPPPAESAVDASVQSLIGLGPGLSPSGDDFLLGFLAGARTALEASAPPRGGECASASLALLAAAVERCVGGPPPSHCDGAVCPQRPAARTSEVSESFLRHALCNRFGEPVLEVLRALLAPRRAGESSPGTHLSVADEVLGRALSFGASSGADTLVGVLEGVRWMAARTSRQQ